MANRESGTGRAGWLTGNPVAGRRCILYLEPMTTLTLSQAPNHITDAIQRVSVGGERVLFAQRGKPLAVLVPVEDLAALERMEDEIDLKELRKARREYERHGGISLDEVLAKADRRG